MFITHLRAQGKQDGRYREGERETDILRVFKTGGNVDNAKIYFESGDRWKRNVSISISVIVLCISAASAAAAASVAASATLSNILISHLPNRTDSLDLAARPLVRGIRLAPSDNVSYVSTFYDALRSQSLLR